MVFLTGIQYPIIKSQAFFIDNPIRLRDDPRPADRETECVLSAFRQHADIFLDMMIEITGNIAGDAGCILVAVAELIPDAGAFAILVPSPFALISGGCRSP